MRLEYAQLQRAASASGFQVDPFEKAVRLLDLLGAFFSHPYLSRRFVLKGGTALNLFLLDLPRLSVDIDLNYIGSSDRSTMLAERPRIEQAIQAVCARQGLSVRRTPDDHAGGKWRLSYERAVGGTGTLELDLNFLLRVPLWPPLRGDSPTFLGFSAHQIPLLDLHEIAAGKLAAFFSRNASRDLYDVVRILDHCDIERDKLRLGFVVYGAMNRRDWRSVNIDEVGLSADEAAGRLLPLLRSGFAPDRSDMERWCNRLVGHCRDQLCALLPLEPAELAFLDLINDQGEIRPDLLTDDLAVQGRIQNHPGLMWKALNVRRFRR